MQVISIADFARDLRTGVRTFLRHSGFTSAAIATLALGIGSATSMFAIVRYVLLQPLPYANAGRIVEVVENFSPDDPGGARQQPAVVEVDELAALQSARSLSRMGMYARADVTVRRPGADSIRVQEARLSPALMVMTAAGIALGRPLSTADDQPGSERVAVLSERTWRRQFGSDPAVVGSTIDIDGDATAIVGVVAEAYSYPFMDIGLWIPIVPTIPRFGGAGARRFRVHAQLADDVPLTVASAEVNWILGRLRGFDFDLDPSAADTLKPFGVRTVVDQAAVSVRPAIVTLGLAVAATLLIATVNVVHLLFAFGVSRRREFAIRLALGASHARLRLQAFAENTALTLAAGAAGLAFAAGAICLLKVAGRSLQRADLAPGVAIPHLSDVHIDVPTTAFAILLCLAIAFVCRGVPVPNRRSRVDGTRDGSAATATLHVSGVRLRTVLATTEVALAVPLVISCALLIQSYLRLSSINPGYDARDVLTFQVASLRDPNVPASYLEDIVARLRATPGISEAAYALNLPMTTGRTGAMLRLQDMPLEDPQPGRLKPPRWPDGVGVSSDFLRLLRIPLLAGRWIDERDRPGTPSVMLINHTLARSGYLGPNPIGQTVFLGTMPFQVVGITGDVRLDSLDRDPTPQVYTNPRQLPSLPRHIGLGAYFAVRSRSPLAGTLGAVRHAVRQVDDKATIDNVAFMTDVIASSISRPRFLTLVIGAFATVAIVLSTVGVYGVIAFLSGMRMKEIGIRLALGATFTRILRLLMTEAAIIATIGTAIGVAVAIAVTGYLRAMLFGVKLLDAATFIATCLAVIGLVGCAALVPAWRTACVDPAVTLRQD